MISADTHSDTRKKCARPYIEVTHTRRTTCNIPAVISFFLPHALATHHSASRNLETVNFFFNICVLYQPSLLLFSLFSSKSVACISLSICVCLSVSLSFFWPLSYAVFQRKLCTPVNLHQPLPSNIRHWHLSY